MVAFSLACKIELTFLPIFFSAAVLGASSTTTISSSNSQLRNWQIHTLRDVGTCSSNFGFIENMNECAIAATNLGLLETNDVVEIATLQSNPFGCYLKNSSKIVYFNAFGNRTDDDQDRISICRAGNDSCETGAYFDFSVGECTRCTEGTAFLNSTDVDECTPCTTCSTWMSEERGLSNMTWEGLEYESKSCTITSDRVCKAVSPLCTTNEFASALPSPSSDRSCEICRMCPVEHFQASECSYTTDTVCLPCSTCGFRTSDVVFVLDGSASVQGIMWNRTLEFAIHMAGLFPRGSQFAAITFSQDAEIQFFFSNSSQAASNEIHIRNLFHIAKPRPGASDVAEALRLLNTVLFDPEAANQTGFRQFRVPTVLVMLVNGRSTNPDATIREASILNQYSSLQRFVGAVGPVPIGTYGEELIGIAGNSSNIYPTETYDQLDTFILALRSSLCTPGCSEGEIEIAPCTRTSDRVCVASPTMPPSYSPSHSPSEYSTTTPIQVPTLSSSSTFGTTSTRACESGHVRSGTNSCSECPTGSWVGSGGHECIQVSICESGEYETTTPTTSSDRQCGLCLPGTYHNGMLHIQTCLAWSKCQSSQFILQDGTSSTDRICDTCTMCAQEVFELAACSPTSDTICVESSSSTVHTLVTAPGNTSSIGNGGSRRDMSIIVLIIVAILCILLLCCGILCIRRRHSRQEKAMLTAVSAEGDVYFGSPNGSTVYVNKMTPLRRSSRHSMQMSTSLSELDETVSSEITATLPGAHRSPVKSKSEVLEEFNAHVAQIEQSYQEELKRLARLVYHSEEQKAAAVLRAEDLEAQHQAVSKQLQEVQSTSAENPNSNAVPQQLNATGVTEQELLRQQVQEEHKKWQDAERRREEAENRLKELEQLHRCQQTQSPSLSISSAGSQYVDGRDSPATTEEKRQQWRLQRRIFLEREGDVGRLNPTQLQNFGGGKIVEKGRPELRIIRRWEQNEVLKDAAGASNSSALHTNIKTNAERSKLAEEIRVAAESAKQMAKDVAESKRQNFLDERQKRASRFGKQRITHIEEYESEAANSESPDVLQARIMAAAWKQDVLHILEELLAAVNLKALPTKNTALARATRVHVTENMNDIDITKDDLKSLINSSGTNLSPSDQVTSYLTGGKSSTSTKNLVERLEEEATWNTLASMGKDV